MQCIFCHKESASSKSIEHIVPESLGNKHHFLPKGYVCDQCNNYFSVKIENELLRQPYFVSLRFRNEILTKKGKFVKEKMFFPEVTKSCEVIMESSDSGPVMSFYDEELYDLIAAGKTHTMIGLYLPEPDFPNVIMSRFLAKCAFEFFLYNVGRDNYDLCVHELLGKEHDILKNLREYARYGKGKYWQYNQRRLYSEGDIFLNQKENSCYEILHEMRLFVKDHKRHPNGNEEAEIYFILAIAGIEYAICLSDPDISEYQKWVEDHHNQSPLNDNNETYIFSLSASNPLLIKKDRKDRDLSRYTEHDNMKLYK